MVVSQKNSNEKSHPIFLYNGTIRSNVLPIDHFTVIVFSLFHESLAATWTLKRCNHNCSIQSVPSELSCHFQKLTPTEPNSDLLLFTAVSAQHTISSTWAVNFCYFTINKLTTVFATNSLFLLNRKIDDLMQISAAFHVRTTGSQTWCKLNHEIIFSKYKW